MDVSMNISMNASLNSTYFINQIKDTKDKDIFIEYYNNFQLHLEHTKKYIEIKQNMNTYIQNILINREDLTTIDRITFEELNNEIKNGLQLIELDAMKYKDNFVKILFYLIKK
jgi:hypothetical protein